MGAIDIYPSPGFYIDFTPTLTQSATPSKTVTYARYQRLGRMITAQVVLAVTGTSGTASNNVVIGLPVDGVVTADLTIGVGAIYNASNFATYPGIAFMTSSTTIVLVDATVSGISTLGSAQFTDALASGDRVTYSVTYEAAS